MNASWKVAIVGVTGVAVAAVLLSRPHRAPAASGAVPERAAPVGPSSCPPPRVLDIGMRTCRPCKMMLQVLAELDSEYRGRLRSEFVDIGDEPDDKDRYGVRVIPTQILYDRSGVEFYRHEGFIPKADLLLQFERRGIDLSPRCLDRPPGR